MATEQEKEWEEAQKIEFSIDLVTATKDQLKFLAVVDRNRYLYEGPALQWAIYRYNAYWLPLLAKHVENPISKDPIVVPLDCEWIWHCHRLNPVKYKNDCEKLFGRVLGNHNIISSIKVTSKGKTEEIWNRMYPEEPYELDNNREFPDVSQKSILSENFTNYDLVSAVGRKVSFYYQVSRPHMSDDIFLQESLARYKGFLHLIKTNKKNNVKRFCAPTYDIDLMWHSHQLHPTSYCNDLIKLLGNVLVHDDTENDRTKGKKLHTSYIGTTKQWEETFGFSYRKAGATYRGTTPTPVTKIPFPFIHEGNNFHAPSICDNLISTTGKKVVEVLLECVEIKNLPEAYKGNLYVLFSKTQPDMFFSGKRTFTVLRKHDINDVDQVLESAEKQVPCFLCEPIGEFHFELIHHFPSKTSSKSFKQLGSCSLSFQECFTSRSYLSINKWLQVVPIHETLASKPILMNIYLSFTPPTPAPKVFQLLKPQSFEKVLSFSSLPKIGNNEQHANGHTSVIDDDGYKVLNLVMRDFSKDLTKSDTSLQKEVLHITNSGETHTLARLQGKEWVIEGSHGSLKLHCTSEKDGHFIELIGDKMVRLFEGRKLDYEPKNNEKKGCEQDFMTVVEFSIELPYGRAIALIDFKHGLVEVMDEWIILTSVTLTFILYDLLRKEGRHSNVKKCYEDIMLIQAIDGDYEGKFGDNCENMIEMADCSGGCCNNCVEMADCSGGCCNNCVEMVDCSGGCCNNCVDEMAKYDGGCDDGYRNMVNSVTP